MKGNRKLLVVMIAYVLMTTLALLSKLTTEAVEVLVVGVLAFAGGNMVEHWTNSKRGRNE